MGFMVHGPQWFYGFDAVLEFITIVTSILIGYFSIKAYHITKKKDYLFLGSAFYLISIGFIIKSLTYLSIYFKLISPYTDLIRKIFVEIEIIYIVGIFFYKFCVLSGFLTLFYFSQKVESKNIFSMMIYLLFLLSLLLIRSEFLFNLIIIGLLGYVIDYFIKNYRKNSTRGARLVRDGFILLFISRIIFLFLTLIPHIKILYVIGVIVQMISFIMLFFVYMRVHKR
jgi:hypothetical protein